MSMKELFTDDDAVSPVIGVILMVAITVILAAVIATFVLGLGEQISDSAPQASFDYELDESPDPNELTITHTGGASLDADTISIGGDPSDSDIGTWTDSTIGAGDSITITGVTDGNTVQVIWESPNGDQTAILSEW